MLCQKNLYIYPKQLLLLRRAEEVYAKQTVRLEINEGVEQQTYSIIIDGFSEFPQVTKECKRVERLFPKPLVCYASNTGASF